MTSNYSAHQNEHPISPLLGTDDGIHDVVFETPVYAAESTFNFPYTAFYNNSASASLYMPPFNFSFSQLGPDNVTQGPTVNVSEQVRGQVTTAAMRRACNLRRKREARFHCEICLESFTVKHSLNRHIDSHYRKRYQCRYCGATFGNKCDCRRHEKLKHEL